ncbi:hypothetical protein Tco_0023363 [Tanacetum coccineum]
MSGRPTAGQPPSSPANFPATTTSPPPEKFSGGLIRPTPKILPTSGSTRPTTSLSFTRHHHPHVTTNSHATIIIVSSSSYHHHHHPVTPSPPKPPPQPPPPKGARGFITTNKGAFWVVKQLKGVRFGWGLNGSSHGPAAFDFDVINTQIGCVGFNDNIKGVFVSTVSSQEPGGVMVGCRAQPAAGDVWFGCQTAGAAEGLVGLDSRGEGGCSYRVSHKGVIVDYGSYHSWGCVWF